MTLRACSGDQCRITVKKKEQSHVAEGPKAKISLIGSRIIPQRVEVLNSLLKRNRTSMLALQPAADDVNKERSNAAALRPEPQGGCLAPLLTCVAGNWLKPRIDVRSLKTSLSRSRTTFKRNVMLIVFSTKV